MSEADDPDGYDRRRLFVLSVLSLATAGDQLQTAPARIEVPDLITMEADGSVQMQGPAIPNDVDLRATARCRLRFDVSRAA